LSSSSISYIVFHFRDALVAVFYHELQSVFIQLFEQGQNGAENVFIATEGVIVYSALACRSLFLVVHLLRLLLLHRYLFCVRLLLGLLRCGHLMDLLLHQA